MKIITGYEVIEQYDDGMREPFGLHGFEDTPREGDVVTLRGLDGSPAYDVIVREVHEDRLRVVVEAVCTPEAKTP